MRVLFVYKYLSLGGVEAVLRARLEHLPSHGVHAEAWFFEDYGGGSMFVTTRDRTHLGTPAECVAYARSRGFDVLCTLDSEEIVGALGPERSPRLVFECHSAYPETLSRIGAVPDLRPVAVFAPSEAHRATARRILGDGAPVRVVPNPVSQEFVADLEVFASAPPAPVVCWIGRLDDHKNWQGFLEVVEHLPEDRPFEAWLVGKPVEARGAIELLERARQRRVLGRLRWFRGLAHERIPALLDAVRDSGGVTVTTSRGESFGMTVVEAMARACCVVVPDEGPFTELVEPGVSGELYRSVSFRGAAAKVAALLDDHARRRACGERARRSVLERFAPEVVIPMLARELARVVSEDGSAALSSTT